MQKIIKIDKKVIIVLNNGDTHEVDNISDDVFTMITEASSDDEVLSIINPNYTKIKQEVKEIEDIKSLIEDSLLLELKDNSVYWSAVSPLSMPIDLAKVILDAELNHDEVRVNTYRNFWTLLSLNPDEQCRKNLLWFLNKWGLKISKCGFFVAYRNATFYRSSKDGEDIYTDVHSGTTRIKIGEVVTMPREECDTDSSHSCSRGLHAGGAGWLKKNYFGSQGLVVLINPCDVTAVPYIDDYGKLRTCAYLPIAKAEFDDYGNVIPFEADDGFDCGYVTKVIYEGLMGTEKDSPYKIKIPNILGINKESISDRLLDIAMKCITERQI